MPNREKKPNKEPCGRNILCGWSVSEKQPGYEAVWFDLCEPIHGGLGRCLEAPHRTANLWETGPLPSSWSVFIF